MFDPVADTFDSLRRRSPFCLTTILFIALSQAQANMVGISSQSLQTLRAAAGQESRRLAADSLFETSPRVESVQAMILLAAYAEKAWFALGHTLQMAATLGLDRAVGELMEKANAKTTAPASDIHELMRKARTWFILHHIERELAFGTANKPRLSQIHDVSLREYLRLPCTTSSDIRFISTIELVQLRGKCGRTVSNFRANKAANNRWLSSRNRIACSCCRTTSGLGGRCRTQDPTVLPLLGP